MEGLQEAKDCIEELRASIEEASTALENLEGCISDTETLDNVTLRWGGVDSKPYIDALLCEINLISATFNYEFEEEL